MSETATETAYAIAVVEILRDYFPDLNDPDVAEVAVHSIEEQARNPRDSFEFIVDDPISAKWRLKADPGDRRRMHLACYRVRRSDADAELWGKVNSALAFLVAAQDSTGEEKQR